MTQDSASTPNLGAKPAKKPLPRSLPPPITRHAMTQNYIETQLGTGEFTALAYKPKTYRNRLAGRAEEAKKTVDEASSKLQ
ncbi:hypothetical protein E8E14_014704 [Neopestalotiopsis sp. 37M]|nr:hypothetical protein E8E14_014704 [Neopestalotiopsis sp. 37M]